MVAAVSADEIRRITDDVLSRPEYAEAQPSLWDRFVGAAMEVIGRMIAALSESAGGSVLAAVLLVGGLAAVLVAVAVLTRRVQRGAVAPTPHVSRTGRSPDAWLGDALDHEAAGRWRDALRCRYRALIADLASGGLTDEVPGRTSGEYLAAVRTSVPDATEAFTAATRAFELAWYGHGQVGPDEVVAFARAAGAVATAAGTRTPAGVGA